MKLVKESLNEIKKVDRSPLKTIGASYKTSDGYIQQEEGMLLQRVGNWNYFKEKDPYDPWEPSKLNDSIRRVKLSDLIMSETPSESKLSRMGDYQQPEYTKYSTHWPVAIEYRGKLVLLDGHHRVELAKRAGEEYMDIAVKNRDNIYESLNEIKIENTSGLGSIGVGQVAYLKAWNSAKKEIPQIIYKCKQMSEVFADTKYDELREVIEEKGNFSLDDMLWIDVTAQSYNNTVEDMIFDWKKKWDFSEKLIFKTGANIFTDHTICNFDKNGRVGTLVISKSATPGGKERKIDGIFIQNK